MIHVSFKLPCPGDQTEKFRLALGFPHGASKSQKTLLPRKKDDQRGRWLAITCKCTLYIIMFASLSYPSQQKLSCSIHFSYQLPLCITKYYKHVTMFTYFSPQWLRWRHSALNELHGADGTQEEDGWNLIFARVQESHELGTGCIHGVIWQQSCEATFIFIQPAALLYKGKGITFGLMVQRSCQSLKQREKKSTKHARTWQLLQAGLLSVSFSEQPYHQGMDCKPSKSKDRVRDRCPRCLAMHWLHHLSKTNSFLKQ